MEGQSPSRSSVFKAGHLPMSDPREATETVTQRLAHAIAFVTPHARVVNTSGQILITDQDQAIYINSNVTGDVLLPKAANYPGRILKIQQDPGAAVRVISRNPDTVDAYAPNVMNTYQSDGVNRWRREILPSVNVTTSETIDANGVMVGAEPVLNLKAGANMTITAADNPANGEVDVTFNSTAAGGGSWVKTLLNVNGTRMQLPASSSPQFFIVTPVSGSTTLLTLPLAALQTQPVIVMCTTVMNAAGTVIDVVAHSGDTLVGTVLTFNMGEDYQAVRCVSDNVNKWYAW